jgi:hypothetical protein
VQDNSEVFITFWALVNEGILYSCLTPMRKSRVKYKLRPTVSHRQCRHSICTLVLWGVFEWLVANRIP